MPSSWFGFGCWPKRRLIGLATPAPTKTAAFNNNQPSRFTAWRLFISSAHQ
jgi:hypothetical protein